MAVSFRQAEQYLYYFPIRLKQWQDRILELYTLRQETDCHAQNYEASHASQGTHSEPVASYYAKIEAAEFACDSLAVRVIPIMRLRNFLKNASSERYRVMHLVMELKYFEGFTLGYIAHQTHKSEKTISRRRYELIDLTIDELERGVFDYELECYYGSYPSAGNDWPVSGAVPADPSSESLGQS